MLGELCESFAISAVKGFDQCQEDDFTEYAKR
jgi:hypothetical protein